MNPQEIFASMTVKAKRIWQTMNEERQRFVIMIYASHWKTCQQVGHRPRPFSKFVIETDALINS